ncbi:MAG: DHH family phosphoesterase [Tenacibaculum sp.]
MILKQIKELQKLLSKSQNTVIIGHKNPDGDAVGSSLGLMHYLEKKGHKAQVIMPNDYPEFLHWMPGSETTCLFSRQNGQCLKALQRSSLIFLLDFNALHRVGSDMQQALEKCKSPIALIDHHQEPDEFTYMYSDTTMSSTCQMVYNFIEMMGNLPLIDKKIATCLYTGIMTDTGSFRFRSTTSTTHRIVANLIDKGAENDKIHSNVNDSFTHSRLLLLSKAISNLKILPTYKTAFITLTAEEKLLYDCQKGDTEGIVNYALSLKGIIFGVIFIEDQEQGIIKISFRSKGKFSVNKFAKNYFDGGGHNNAAGGKSKLNMEDTVTKFESLLPKYKSELLANCQVF